jgi:hypothetical protein
MGLATAAADAVPPAIWELALEVTPMTVNRTKLIAACVLVAGGLGIGFGAALVPDADAQAPPLPGAPGPGGPLPPPGGGDAGLPQIPGGGGELGVGSGIPGGPGVEGSSDGLPGDPAAGAGLEGMYDPYGMGMMSGGAPASPRWDYQFDALPTSLDAFRKLVVKRGQDGWEFAGQVTFPRANGEPEFAAPPTSQLVFKRPVRSGSGRSGGGMMGPGGGGGPMSGGSGRPGRGGPGPRGGSPDAGGPGMPGAGMPGGMGGGMMPGGMPGMPGGWQPQAAGGFQVIPLKHATAGQLSTTLSQLFPSAKVVADDRTNSLILKADADTSKEVRELIQKLDVAGAADPRDPALPGTPGGRGQPRR